MPEPRVLFRRSDVDAFMVTEDHLKLARRMYVRYEDWCEFGAPAIDPKRPYGNGDVYGDMREILAPADVTDEELLALHKEMTTVLQIGLRTGKFEAGSYVADRYSGNWRAA